jgi:hypothetical protein
MALIVDAVGMTCGKTGCGDGHGDVEIPHTRIWRPYKSIGIPSSLAISDNLAEYVDAACVTVGATGKRAKIEMV